MFPLLLVVLVGVIHCVQGFYDPHCDGKQVIVHLFEWKWTDIALECERFLGPAGYCAVQTSPPNEHVVLPGDKYPWWQRYQPVSYKLDSRSGTRAEFIDMVERCNAAGVRIIVDAVINHMAGMGREGVGSGGSSFNTMDEAHDFPAVPYSDKDFTPREMCPSGCGCVDNYADPNIVRNCYLVGLSDLYGATDYVRDRVAEYLNDMIDIGVAGFRIDAAKHMWPEDIAAMQSRLHDLNPRHFKAGSKPFFAHEVIDRNDGAVLVSEYFDLGWVTEFRYCQKLSEAAYQGWGTFLGLYVPDWGMGLPDRAFVFADNHDNQRGHGGAGGVVTHKDPAEYTWAVAFTLAQDYGFTRIMSSYYFDDNTDRGPPYYDDGYYSTADVVINEDGSCGGGWVCEHRWNAIYKMAEFRNAVVGSAMVEGWCDGDSLGIAREGKGYFAMTKASGGFSKTVSTTLPAGEYCNIIDSCANKVTVGSDGTASITVNNKEGILAICVGCTGEDFPIVTATPGTPTAPTKPGDTTTTRKTTPMTTATTISGVTTSPTVTQPTTQSTTTDSGQTTTPAQGTCCKTVMFSSDGVVSSNKGSVLGKYYFVTVDQNNRIVYQHEEGKVFLHYVDDPSHRLKAWMVSSFFNETGSDLLSEGDEACADNSNQSWEVLIGSQWQQDVSAVVTCEDVGAGCCNGLELFSSGPIADIFPDILGTYRQVGVENGKPSYTNGAYSVYYAEDAPHHLFAWTVAPSGSDQLGSVLSESEADCAEETGNTWEFFPTGGNSWVKDPEFRVDCHHFSDCCQNITVSSTGTAQGEYPELLGDYYQNGEADGHPVYTGPAGATIQFKRDLAHNWLGWSISSGDDGLGSIIKEEDVDCPNMVMGWEVWVAANQAWELDNTITASCYFTS